MIVFVLFMHGQLNNVILVRLQSEDSEIGVDDDDDDDEEEEDDDEDDEEEEDEEGDEFAGADLDEDVSLEPKRPTRGGMRPPVQEESDNDF